jgi:hypothetical protein
VVDKTQTPSAISTLMPSVRPNHNQSVVKLLPFSLWMMRSRWQLADRVATNDECRHR